MGSAGVRGNLTFVVERFRRSDANYPDTIGTIETERFSRFSGREGPAAASYTDMTRSIHAGIRFPGTPVAAAFA